MPLWLQHLLVLLIVAGCVSWVVWQGVRTLFGRRSKLGSCCAKGCSPAQDQDAKSQQKRPSERIAFIPVEMLTRRR